MTDLNRRNFGKLAAGVAAASLFAPSIARAAPQRLAVIGGGPGGATLAKYVARDSKGAIDVTLIEANPTHTTCFFSNLYLGDFVTLDSLNFGYDALRSKYGVNVVHAMAEAVEENEVALTGGGKINFDRAVVAPGIDFKYEDYDGYNPRVAATRMPHAYKAGPQTQLLKRQLESMRDGGTVLICAPPNPFRCPPGPYERVSMMANYLSKHKPRSKIMILDAKDKFSKQGLFMAGWADYYPGMVEFVPGEFTGGGIASVDEHAMTVTTLEGETFKGDVINMIPAQKAGEVAIRSGLTGTGGWAPVNPTSMESTKREGVYVIGDSSANGDMPKSGFSANSQAKACAMAIRAAMTDAKAFPPRYRNTCWSLIAADDAVKVGANYEATAEKIAKTDGFISQKGESGEVRAETAAEARAWYDAITQDIFG